MISFHTDQKIALIERKKWQKIYNNFNLSLNLHFSTVLKADWGARRENCGGSNDLNRIKIDQRKGVASDDFISYWPKDSIDWTKKCRMNYGGSNVSNRIKIDPQKASIKILFHREYFATDL